MLIKGKLKVKSNRWNTGINNKTCKLGQWKKVEKKILLKDPGCNLKKGIKHTILLMKGKCFDGWKTAVRNKKCRLGQWKKSC